jgi:large subunit ribosomal protein L9
MKVILKEYVYKHGVAGDVVDVANGFARNFLIPRGLAIKATTKAVKDNEALLNEAAMRRNELNERLVAVAQQLNGVELIFGRKAGSNGKLYGSVTTTDIAEALLKKTGLDINRRRISDRSLREIGSFNIPVRMGADLNPELKIVIVREEDLAAYLVALEGTPIAESPAAEGEELDAAAVASLAEEPAAEESVEDAAVQEEAPAAEDEGQEETA